MMAEIAESRTLQAAQAILFFFEIESRRGYEARAESLVETP